MVKVELASPVCQGTATSEVYDALGTTMGKRSQPFLLSISTATGDIAGIGKQ